jgi:hypothetical protein
MQFSALLLLFFLFSGYLVLTTQGQSLSSLYVPAPPTPTVTTISKPTSTKDASRPGDDIEKLLQDLSMYRPKYMNCPFTDFNYESLTHWGSFGELRGLAFRFYAELTDSEKANGLEVSWYTCLQKLVCISNPRLWLRPLSALRETKKNEKGTNHVIYLSSAKQRYAPTRQELGLVQNHWKWQHACVMTA